MGREHDFEPSSDDYAGLDVNKLWGSAQLVNTIPKDATTRQIFYIAAAALGISTPGGMYEYYLKKSTPESDMVAWMADRMVRVCELTQHIWARAKEINPGLYKLLIAPVERRKHRELGKYEIGRVGQSFIAQVDAVARPPIWGITRMIIDFEGEELLDAAISESSGSGEFFCRFAEALHTQRQIPAEELVGLMLKDTILAEQNNPEMYFAVIDAMPYYSPKLWKEVCKLYEEKGKREKVPGWMGILEGYKVR